MKINPLDYTGKPELSSSREVPNDNGFKTIFDNKIKEVISPTPQPSRDAGMGLLAQGDKVLNLLEDYAKGLADPEKTLKDMKPLIECIEREVDGIEKRIFNGVHGDQDLAGLIKEVTVTANVAISKYYRGDYL